MYSQREEETGECVHSEMEVLILKHTTQLLINQSDDEINEQTNQEADGQ